MSQEILVAGGGVAGLRTATSLMQHGAEHVTLVERQPQRAERTWFALKNRLPPDVITAVMGNNSSYQLTGTQFIFFNANGKVSNKISIDLADALEPGANLMIDQAMLETYLLSQARKAGVSIVHDSITTAAMSSQGFDVNLKEIGPIRANTVIDATGPHSVLQRELGVLNDDPLVLWVYGGRMRGDFNPTQMLFPLTASTGKLSWITPWSANEADVVASDYCRLSEFQHKIPQFKRMFEDFIILCQKNGICNTQEMLQHIVGKIRVVPIKKPQHKEQIYAVGEAAGQACPNMAEGLTAALRQGDKLGAHIIFHNSPSPQNYHDQWYRDKKTREYPYPLALATLLKRVMREEAGGNSEIYRAVVNHGTPEDKLRWLTERSVRPKDIPYMILEAGLHPSIILQVVELLHKMVMFNTTSHYDNMLWGAGQDSK